MRVVGTLSLALRRATAVALAVRATVLLPSTNLVRKITFALLNMPCPPAGKQTSRGQLPREGD